MHDWGSLMLHTVMIANKVYRVGKLELNGLLNIASESVPFGVYAVKKDDIYDLANKPCKSITELKSVVRTLKKQGYKVFANGL